jgi:hypothetical protein
VSLDVLEGEPWNNDLFLLFKRLLKLVQWDGLLREDHGRLTGYFHFLRGLLHLVGFGWAVAVVGAQQLREVLARCLDICTRLVLAALTQIQLKTNGSFAANCDVAEFGLPSTLGLLRCQRCYSAWAFLFLGNSYTDVAKFRLFVLFSIGLMFYG